MSLPVFIFDLPSVLQGNRPELPTTGTVSLDGPEGRHAVSVKRIREGERIMLSDAHGTLATVRVTGVAGKDRLQAEVEESVTVPGAQPSVTVFQALPKAERSELAVDLLTQAGADEIVPWEAHRCVAKWVGAKREKGAAKWRQAAISAAKQSRRAIVPPVATPHTTAEVAARLTDFDLVLVLHEEATLSLARAVRDAGLAAPHGGDALADAAAASEGDDPAEHDEAPARNKKRIALIIGPEGGITAEEVAAFEAAGAKAIKLGPEVLRTATAGMVALGALGVLTERWG